MKRYVRKYDYIQSFNRPKDEWLVDSQTITNFLKDKILEEITKQNVNSEVEEQNDEEEHFECDSYEYYKQTKDESNKQDLDNGDPKIIEGNKIDLLSRECVKKTYPHCQSIDLDGVPREVAAQKTIELLKKDNVIIFQSCFIWNKAITRPDAIIKTNNQWIIIETKGTTGTRISHFADIYYQKNVVDKVLEKHFDACLTDFKLCIVKYELCKRNEISLVIVDKCCVGKGAKSIDRKAIAELNATEKMHYIRYVKENATKPDKDNFDYSINEMLLKPNDASISTKDKNKILKYFGNENEFWQRIDEIYDHKIKEVNELSFKPTIEYKGNEIKDVDYWMTLRDYYYFSNNPDYLPFQFSGELIKFVKACEICSYLKGKINSIDEFVNALESLSRNGTMPIKPKSKLDIYISTLFHQNSLVFNYQNIYAYKNEAKELFNKLKSKKVYFDFESLNLATRVVDNFLPFRQTVNQVSIIFDHGQGLEHLEEVPYIVIDPLKGLKGNGMTKDDFKYIIDAILPSKDLAECEQYHYIVFNKSFECTRLNEMADYINEPEYRQKVKIINSNIYDIAELFIISDKNQAVIFKELKGYYSIKKVLPLVSKYEPDIFTQTKCKDYKKDLKEIHNGVDAQTASTKRFFNLLTDEEWQVVRQHLGEYCDNDVRAMIAIEYFLKRIFSNN